MIPSNDVALKVQSLKTAIVFMSLNIFGECIRGVSKHNYSFTIFCGDDAFTVWNIQCRFVKVKLIRFTTTTAVLKFYLMRFFCSMAPFKECSLLSHLSKCH